MNKLKMILAAAALAAAAVGLSASKAPGRPVKAQECCAGGACCTGGACCSGTISQK